MRGAVLAVDDREGLAPVALAGEQPVAQTVADRALADAGRFEPGVDLGDGVVHAQAIERKRVALGCGGVHGRVDHDAIVGDERSLALVVGQVVAGFRQGLDGVDDRQAELDSEVVIALVAARHGHDGTGAVVHQDVISGEQRKLGTSNRIGGVQAREQTGLLAGLVNAVLGGLGFSSQTIGLHCLDRVGIAALPILGHISRPFGRYVLQQVMFRGNDGERGAEQRVGTGGVDFHAVQLAAHVGDVRLGGHARVLAGLDGVLLGRQTESVIAHGVQDVLSLHAVVTAHHIGGQIAQRMTYVQALAGRVWEHVHGKVGGAAFGVATFAVLQIAVDVGGPEGAFLIPDLLPFVLDILRQRGVVAEVGLFGLRALLVVTHKSAR